MAHNKIGQLKVRTSVANHHDIETNYIFYSYDKGSAAFDFRLKNQKNEALDLTNVTVKLLFTAMQDNEERKFTYLDSQPVIENPEEGRILYPLPDKLLNYEGEVKGYLYLDFEDGSHSDELSFTFTVVRSKIDETLEEVDDIYIKDFEQVRNEVFEAAKREKEAIEALRPELEESLVQLNEQVESLGQKVAVNEVETNRLLQLIENNGVLSKEEFILALARGYFEFEKELNFQGKIVGSMVENPNNATDNILLREGDPMPTPNDSLKDMSSSPTPENARVVQAFNGTGFVSISMSGWGNDNYHPFVRIQWDVVETIRRWLGEEYYLSFQAETMEERVKFVEKGLWSITPLNEAYASHYDETKQDWFGGISVLWYDNAKKTWNEFGRNEERKRKVMTQTIDKHETSQFLDNKGRVNILLFGDKANRMGLNYSKATLKITYRIYLSDILYYKRDPTIDRMQTQIQQLWDKVFNN
ncbi:phage baseplate upper protein [Enterococcus faecalis]|uniref:phage baseplate upper protein n=1 Tax=Enterococcus faecalis TaxID=1351 RepID=UPI0019FCF84E|nr:phage baseplate upper protein [Enterococcus faecalis]EGO2800809.1 phage baseplate upper protein [Enterococcus faecalis]EJB2752946.1 phage baseplate upper protein [Enterococcus faecalis]EKZ0433633.1 phage baseplate upper protein [Enterococcus faecalis]MCU9781967.1 phage baseplate upper protein [Enterococcus faecalis]MCU9796571.1 phage baseplate upper protein [Enterococcus faecalis]